MKKNILFKALVIVFGLVAYNPLSAQCDSTASLCDKHIADGFISDGQTYKSLLVGEEIAEFSMTLYGGSTYRFAGCSGDSDGKLIFSVYDQERNLLFTNKEYSNAPYWDFEIKNTINCIVEANLNSDITASGCAVLLVGFRQ